MISPQLDIFGKGVMRKWLKVRVTNPGRAIATKCRADLDVIPAKGLKYPSDSKRLMWDDDTEEKNIRIKDSKGEILKVVFRDSDFPIGYIHAMVSTKEAETLPRIRAQDGFEFGAFDVRISVASDDAKESVQKMFRIHTGNDMNDFSIQAIQEAFSFSYIGNLLLRPVLPLLPTIIAFSSILIIHFLCHGKSDFPHWHPL